MANKLAAETLEELKAPLMLYLSELGVLTGLSPACRAAFKLSVRGKLSTLQDAIAEARRTSGVALPDSEVIAYGLEQSVEQSITSLAGCTEAPAAGSDGIMLNLNRTVELLAKNRAATLTGLLEAAKKYRRHSSQPGLCGSGANYFLEN